MNMDTILAKIRASTAARLMALVEATFVVSLSKSGSGSGKSLLARSVKQQPFRFRNLQRHKVC